MTAWVVLALLVLTGLFLLLRGNPELLTGMGTFEIGLLAVGLVLVGVYVALLLGDERVRPLQAVKHLFVWAIIAFLLVGIYSYRNELSGFAYRVAGELVPPGQTLSVQSEHEGEQAVRVRRRLDGHFAVRGSINSQPMTLLVDTGASSVVLRHADAEQAGIDTSRLTFNVAVHTANGTTYAAPVRLRSVSIGPITVSDVEALVARPGSVNENLLGISFLRRLRSYEFSKDFLTLRS